MSKPFKEIKKIYEAIQKINISRDELASLDENELQEILKLALSIEAWSAVISRIIDDRSLPSFLQRIDKFFNETTTFASWHKEVDEMKEEDLKKARESLLKSINNIDFMLDFVEREMEKREANNRFWRNERPNQ